MGGPSDDTRNAAAPSEALQREAHTETEGESCPLVTELMTPEIQAARSSGIMEIWRATFAPLNEKPELSEIEAEIRTRLEKQGVTLEIQRVSGRDPSFTSEYRAPVGVTKGQYQHMCDTGGAPPFPEPPVRVGKILIERQLQGQEAEAALYLALQSALQRTDVDCHSAKFNLEMDLDSLGVPLEAIFFLREQFDRLGIYANTVINNFATDLEKLELAKQAKVVAEILAPGGLQQIANISVSQEHQDAPEWIGEIPEQQYPDAVQSGAVEQNLRDRDPEWHAAVIEKLRRYCETVAPQITAVVQPLPQAESRFIQLQVTAMFFRALSELDQLVQGPDVEGTK